MSLDGIIAYIGYTTTDTVFTFQYHSYFKSGLDFGVS